MRAENEDLVELFRLNKTGRLLADINLANNDRIVVVDNAASPVYGERAILYITEGGKSGSVELTCDNDDFTN